MEGTENSPRRERVPKFELWDIPLIRKMRKTKPSRKIRKRLNITGK